MTCLAGRRFAFFIALVLWFICAHTSWAQNNNLTITATNASDPNNGDIYFGDVVELVVSWNGGDLLTNVQWHYVNTSCNPQTLTNFDNGDESTSFTCAQLSDITFLATVTFSNADMTQFYSLQATLAKSVLSPDAAALVNDVNLPILDVNVPTTTFADGPNLNCHFQVKGGGRVLDIGAAASVEEQVERTKYGKAPDRAMGPATYLSWSGVDILDQKGVVGDAGFLALGVGATIDEFDQTLAIDLPTGCGTTQRCVLAPAFHFQMIKVDNNNWTLHKP